MEFDKVYQGDVLEVLKSFSDDCVDCVVTSPPYFGLRDYGICGQIGLEETPEEYVAKIVEVFEEVKRVLKSDGTLWLNLGDSYASSGKVGGDIDIDVGLDIRRGRGRLKSHPLIKPKDLIGIPWRVAFALQADGWWLRQDIIWHKPAPMPESVTDRCTKSHEYVFLLSKKKDYYFNNEAIKEKGVMQSSGSYQRDTRKTHGLGGGNSGINNAKERMRKELDENGFVMRNKRSVWTINTKPYKEAHFAVFPPELPSLCIKAGCPEEICKKCGHIRTLITEKGDFVQTGGKRVKDTPSLSEAQKTEGSGYHLRKASGWDECDCGVGFEGGVVLDPFAGSGTTLFVAKHLLRRFVGIELNPAYVKIIEKRLAQDNLTDFFGEAQTNNRRDEDLNMYKVSDV